jgi:CubicO group peptidase (beta-lactamase class C family)
LRAHASAGHQAVYGQDRTADVDRIFNFATPETPGCAVGASKNGKILANRVYGLADVESRTPLSEGAIFDIGSTQKQFVAAAVLLLVEDKRLSLSDDIRKYLPTMPDYGHPITVNHLLTHTSGIRDWTGLLPLSSEGTDAATLILRQHGINFIPGEEWSYSNSGYVLLKEIVARVSGMSFADFARQRLFDPLGMKSSAYVEDILEGGGNRAIGYQKDGAGWKRFMRLGNERGGGAVISTTGDLLTWNDALTTGRLGKFVTAKLEEARDPQQRPQAQLRPRAHDRFDSGRAPGFAFRRCRGVQHVAGPLYGPQVVSSRDVQLRPRFRHPTRGEGGRPLPAAGGPAGQSTRTSRRPGRRRDDEGRGLLR